MQLLGRPRGTQNGRVHGHEIAVRVKLLGFEAHGLEYALGDVNAGNNAGLLWPCSDKTFAPKAHAFGRDVMESPVALQKRINIGLRDT